MECREDPFMQSLPMSLVPQTVQENFDVIVEDGLYEFRTKAPYNVVRNQLKRHCVENTHSCPEGHVLKELLGFTQIVDPALRTCM